MSLQLTFDEPSHEYRYGGVAIPSVTQILEDDGQIIPSYPAGPYRLRGSRVHKATHLWEDGVDLNTYDIGEEIRLYTLSYIKLMEELKWEWLRVEHRMFHPLSAYAGTTDRIRTEPCVVDLKTGKTGRETGLQLAGYVDLAMQDPEILRTWGISDPTKVKRIKFELQKDGSKALLSEYRDDLDFEVFRGLVPKYKWKRKK